MKRELQLTMELFHGSQMVQQTKKWAAESEMYGVLTLDLPEVNLLSFSVTYR